jgi:hypothetical protein
MKKSISSTMDTGKKRKGVLIVLLALVATLCAGVLIVFAATGNGIPIQSPYIIRVEMPTIETNVAVADFDTRTNHATFYDTSGNVLSYRYLESEEAFWEFAAEYGFSQATVGLSDVVEGHMNEVTETVITERTPNLPYNATTSEEYGYVPVAVNGMKWALGVDDYSDEVLGWVRETDLELGWNPSMSIEETLELQRQRGARFRETGENRVAINLYSDEYATEVIGAFYVIAYVAGQAAVHGRGGVIYGRPE